MADGTGAEQFKLAKPGESPPRDIVASAWCETVAGPQWTVPTVRVALEELEGGRFYSAAALAEAFGRDCIVFGALGKRVRALASRYALPFSVEAGEGDGRIKEQVRKRIEELWWTSCPESVIDPICRDSVMLGASVGMIWWDRSATEWIPHLRRLPPHGLEYREWENAWYYTTREGESLRVTPGDGTWFLHLPHGERSFMWGAVRPIGEAWIESRYARRDRARWCERNGMGVLGVNEPDFARGEIEGPDGSKSSQAAQVYADMRRGMRVDGLIRLPQGPTKEDGGWGAKWLESTGKGFEGFGASLRACRDDIEYALFGSSGSGGSKGGDGELADETVRNENLSSDAEPLVTTIRDCVWKPYVAYNRGQQHIELAAWGRYDTVPPAVKLARANLLIQVASAITALDAAGADTTKTYQEFGLKKVADPKQPTAPEPNTDEAKAA